MNKKEAIELLKGAWFVDLSGGKHTQVDVAKALELAEKALEEAKPYKAKAKALRAYAKALETENEALRLLLATQTKALKTLFTHVTEEEYTDPTVVRLVVVAPRAEYMENVDPLEADPRYAEEKGNAENRG